jgi:hypothetical protein
MPEITLDTTKGPIDTQVTVQGSGWLPEDTVIISLADPANEVTQATVDNEGNFTAKFAVPANASIGKQKVIAITANGSWQTDTIFQVTEQKKKPPTPILTITNTAAWKSTRGASLYKIVVTNKGSADATGVTLRAFFPRGLWPLLGKGIHPSQGNCPPPPPLQTPIFVDCDLGILSPGKSAIVFIIVGVELKAEPGKITSIASVTSDQNTKRNQAVSTVEVVKSELTEDDLNESLRLARKCGAVFIGVPFLGLVNEIYDALQGHKITWQEAGVSLRQVILDLIARNPKYASVKVLSTFFGVEECTKSAEKAL